MRERVNDRRLRVAGDDEGSGAVCEKILGDRVDERSAKASRSRSLANPTRRTSPTWPAWPTCSTRLNALKDVAREFLHVARLGGQTMIGPRAGRGRHGLDR